jgi:serine/threonine-protein kinase
MGMVYLGSDPKIGRTVAIKTLALSEEFEDGQLDEVRQRFYQEAETAGQLSHPNIVTIYDAGEEHDLAYIAMDYIRGEALDAYVSKDTLLPLEEVIEIGAKVADALSYAHQNKVVHRDIKPANIMYDKEKGTMKVTDFGIARLTDNSKTRTGVVMGSPFYMSPEQLAGQKVDGRSDIYSLGITLYQLTTGQLPFVGDSIATLAHQITNDKPKRIRKLRADIPQCLGRIIHKALEKDADKRYQDGESMAAALCKCGNGLSGKKTKGARK